MWWQIVKWETFVKVAGYMDCTVKYCNASITRPYIDYADREYSRCCFENLKRIWDGRDCIFVEGEQTKLGVGNDLFDNIKSVGRILCPAENAFDKLDEIKDAIRTFAGKDTLILGALGPTASILAAQMCEEGYQFVDIGHVDIEYIWFLRKAKRREPVDGKYVNECGRQVLSDKCENEEYWNSILTTIR
jgi:glycosyltransferase family protein